MYQGTSLNFSEVPERRAQVSPGPAVVASGGAVDAVVGDLAALDGRVVTLEGGAGGISRAKGRFVYG